MSEITSELSKPLRVSILHSPLPWPDGAHPAHMVAMNVRHVLAVVSRLDAYRPDAVVSVPVSDTEPLHAFIRAEIAQLMAEARATVTETITATLVAQLQELVQAAVSAGISATETDTEPVSGSVTAPETDVETVTKFVTASVADTETVTQAYVTVTETDTEAVPSAQSSGAPPVAAPATATSTDTPPTAYDADAAFARMQALKAQGLTLAQIAAQMTAEGRRTRHGKPWHKSTAAYVLKTHGR